MCIYSIIFSSLSIYIYEYIGIYLYTCIYTYVYKCIAVLVLYVCYVLRFFATFVLIVLTVRSSQAGTSSPSIGARRQMHRLAASCTPAKKQNEN